MCRQCELTVSEARKALRARTALSSPEAIGKAFAAEDWARLGGAVRQRNADQELPGRRIRVDLRRRSSHGQSKASMRAAVCTVRPREV